MKYFLTIGAVIILFFVIKSCDFKTHLKEKVRYVVTAETLNLRDAPSINSNIINKLHQGDTIVTYEQDSEFIYFIYGADVKSYASLKYLNYIGPVPKLSTEDSVINFLDKTLTLKSLLFIIIIIAGVAGGSSLSLYEEDLSNKISWRIKTRDDKLITAPTNFHILFIFLGAAFGVMYYINPIEIQNLIIRRELPLIPTSTLEWFTWSVVVISIIAFIVNTFYILIQYKQYSLIMLPYSYILNMIAFISYWFFVVGLIYLAILALTIFAIYYISTNFLAGMSEGDPSTSSLSSSKRKNSTGLTKEEEQHEFKKRIANQEEARIRREINDINNKFEIMD